MKTYVHTCIKSPLINRIYCTCLIANENITTHFSVIYSPDNNLQYYQNLFCQILADKNKRYNQIPKCQTYATNACPICIGFVSEILITYITIDKMHFF